MSAVNYTPVDRLLSQNQPTTMPVNLPPVSAEPAPMPLHPHNPVPVVHAPPATKESEPFAPPKEAIKYHEPAKQVEVSEEEKPFVEVKKEQPEIPEELKKVGLKQANPDIFKDFSNVKLPISDEKVVQGLHAPLTSGLRWLATFALYLLQQSHMTLKTVHGHVVRIVKK